MQTDYASPPMLIVKRACKRNAIDGLLSAMGADRDLQRRWTKAGRELLFHDPKRFGELLELAERIVKIHLDPLSVPIGVPIGRSRSRRRRPRA